jgi:predicted ATPase
MLLASRHAAVTVPKPRIELLGGFAALTGGEVVPKRAWRLRKGRELVKLLALAPGHRLHREQAMDVFWRDKDRQSAANNLHQAVHVARRVLGAGAIELRDELLRLEADIDVDEFERAAVDARRARMPGAYRAALALYGGELLPENRYDDWAEERRDELAELAAALTAELAALGAVDGMRALPFATTSFVGRKRELAELGSLLAGTRLLTLTGAGGAGKSRLALELARGLEAAYADGAVLVELAPVADGGLVVDAVGDALDVRALPGRDLATAISEFLSGRTVLLVLDNCEHVLLASASIVDELLRTAPGLTIVATSREPLRVPGEALFRVPSLAIPAPDQTLPPAELLGYESVRLFYERARAADPGFALDEANAGDVVRICDRLDGLPLALELAAARLGALEAAAIAERLDDRFRLLRAGSRSAPTRQQTLEATLDWSHDLLADDERTLLRRLAVFSGGFDLAAVEAVCSGEGVDRQHVADVLGRLVEKSLVTTDERSRKRRYRLLETVRLYAGARLADAGETAVRARAHAGWALELAERERADPRLDREAANLHAALDTLVAADKREALRLCVALWPFWLRRIDLQEGVRRLTDALAGVPERTAERANGLLALSALALRAGLLTRAAAYETEYKGIAEEIGDKRMQWRALHVAGGTASADDDFLFAERCFEEAVEFARREGLRAEEALGVYSLGVVRWRQGALEEAERLVESSISSFERSDDSHELIPTPLAVAEMRRLDPDSGPRVVFEDTLQPFFEISPSAAVGYVLANQAQIARERGHLPRARKLLERSIALFRREHDDRGLGDALVRFAYLELGEGHLDGARSSFEHALELRRSQGDKRGVGMALCGLALVDVAAGDHAGAARALAEARELFRRAGDRWGLTGALWNTAYLAAESGDLDEAVDALEEALAVLRETGRDLWIAQTLSHLAEIEEKRGDPDRAAAALREARDLYELKGDAAGVADVESRLQRPQRATS